jgi:hypothetical protein
MIGTSLVAWHCPFYTIARDPVPLAGLRPAGFGTIPREANDPTVGRLEEAENGRGPFA